MAAAHSFTVPYASVAQLLRAGTTRYDVAIGRLRNLSSPAAQRGPGHRAARLQQPVHRLCGLAGFAGVMPRSCSAAHSTPAAGAVALDVTQDRASIPGYRPLHGQSLRLSYSKIIPDSLTVPDRGRLSLFQQRLPEPQDAVRARDYAKRGLDLTQYLPHATDHRRWHAAEHHADAGAAGHCCRAARRIQPPVKPWPASCIDATS